MSSSLQIIQNTLALKCPRCRTGQQFKTGTFSFDKPFDMHNTCPHCGQDYLPEPGFYYGAMFISYIFMGWFSIGLVMLLHWVFGLSTLVSFAILIALVSFFFVYIFRLARSIWLHINVGYDPEAAAGNKNI